MIDTQKLRRISDLLRDGRYVSNTDGIVGAAADTIDAQAEEIAGLREVLKAAMECGMVPKSSAAEGGANKYSQAVRVADQIRAALSQGEQG